MAFNLSEFSKKLFSSINTPTDTNQSSLRTANSTPSVMQKDDFSTKDLLKKGLNLINPLRPTYVRPLFGKADEEKRLRIGGIGPKIGYELAARTIESIPSIALKTLANFRSAAKAATGDISGGSVKVPFDVSRLGISDEVGSNIVTDTGTKMVQTFDRLEKANPGRSGKNIALATLVPITDALDTFVVGDILSSVARQGLRVTNFTPELDRALQQFGLKNSRLSGEELTSEFVRRFNSKARKLINAEDYEGLRQLGEATNEIVTQMTGKGLPQLSRLGQIIQDTSRLALQDAKYGFRLKNPVFSELAPDVTRSALPGFVPENPSAVPVGLSTQRVRRVGGAADDVDGPFYRTKKESGKPTFEEIQKGDVTPVTIRPDLDTFVAKIPEGFAVIEGRTGMQLGAVAKTIDEAVTAAKTELTSLSPEELSKEIDSRLEGGQISPRYEQIPGEVQQSMSFSVPDSVKEMLAPIKREISISSKEEIKEYPLAVEARRYKTAEEFSGKKQEEILNEAMPWEQDEKYRSFDYRIENRKLDDIEEYDATDEDSISTINEYASQIRKGSPPPLITVDKDGDIINGFHRAEAYRQNDIEEIPVLVAIGKNNTGSPRITNLTEIFNKATGRVKPKTEIKSPKIPTKQSNPAAVIKPDKPKGHMVPSEDDSLEILAQQEKEGDYFLNASVSEEEKVADSLTEIFASLKGVDAKDVSTKFTQEDLEMARLNYEMANETLLDHPGRALLKYVSKATGRLPEVTGTDTIKSLKDGKTVIKNSEYGKRGDDIARSILDPNLTGNLEPDAAQKAVDAYIELKKRVAEIQKNFRKIRTEIRLTKQKNQFVASAKTRIAKKAAQDLMALSNLVQAAQREGFKKGSEKMGERLQTMIQRLKSRRDQIRAIQKVYGLTDGQMGKIRGGADPRFMDKEEYEQYLKDLESKADLENKKNIEKMLIKATIEQNELKNPDNLRVAMELPPINSMSLEQLQEYDNALSQYKFQDSFLGPRMIQTVVNTDLGDVKTIREIREALAKESGVDLKELEDVRGDWTDKFSYDAALAEKNPLYKYMVTEFTAKMVEQDQMLLAIDRKLNELATAARKSTKRKISSRLVPQDKKVFQWLETSEDAQADFAAQHQMTPQELEYGRFVKALYKEWRDILIEKGALKKWREAYITHTTQSFFERWKDDGFIRAIGNWWRDLTDARIDFEALGDTGEVLGLEKFFKYSLPREGGMKPSQNVARVVMAYAKSFYKKQALDAIIPKIEAYTFSLQRPQIKGKTPKDPTMVGIDGKLRRFTRQWLNNKKGRRLEYIINQGGKLDASLRAFKLFVSLKDLGLNVISNTANLAGNTMANFFGLSTKAFARGAARSATKQGRSILRKYPGVVGQRPFERLVNAANDIGDTFTAGMFYLMQEGSYRAKGQFFLGKLTPEEFKSGIVSPKRQAQIRLEMARFHPVEGMESLVGNTSEGKILTMYKTWAVPLLYTASRNSKRLLRAFKASEGLSGKAKVLKTEEAIELLKLTVGALGAYLFWTTVFGDDDENDKSAFAKLKRRVAMELTSSLSALDPNTWLSVRPYEFAKDIGNMIHMLAVMERYKTTTDTHEAGELKFFNELKRQFTPAIIRQFTEGGDSDTPIMAPSGSGASASSALKRLERLKSPALKSNPALDRLNRLKKLNLKL